LGKRKALSESEISELRGLVGQVSSKISYKISDFDSIVWYWGSLGATLAKYSAFDKSITLNIAFADSLYALLPFCSRELYYAQKCENLSRLFFLVPLIKGTFVREGVCVEKVVNDLMLDGKIKIY
jgi:hypothetical protein